MRVELLYVALLFAVLIVPKILQRFRLPSAITSFAFGAIAAVGFGLFTHDATINVLSTFGIVALFLFAGLEVSLPDLRRHVSVLVVHVVIQLILLALATALVRAAFPLEPRPAVLLALALVTPSTGFILASLGALGMTENERFWIRSKAVATELVALAVLFVALQSTTVLRLSLATSAMIALIVVVPFMFRALARLVLPYAPNSEFVILVMTAVSCAIATLALGVYYLVGAFVVGLAAHRLQDKLPALTSERMLLAVEAFASIFVPFYFFHAGTTLQRDDFSALAVVIGFAFLALAVPVRIATVMLHRHASLSEDWRQSLRVSVPMVPTLVFTLVIAGILRERFNLARELFGALIVYTVGNTLIPGFVFRQTTPELDLATPPEVDEPPITRRFA